MSTHESLRVDAPMKAVRMFSRTKTVERTELLTNGEVWQVKCSCGWKTRTFLRETTARRHFAAHTMRSTAE